MFVPGSISKQVGSGKENNNKTFLDFKKGVDQTVGPYITQA